MNEHLAGLYTYAMPYHAGCVVALGALCVVYLALTQLAADRKNYVLRIRYFLPIYHAMIACVIMTGLILMSAFSFALNFTSARMIVSALGLIVLSVVGFKRLKSCARSDKLAEFKKFALIKSAADIFLLILAGV